MTNWRKVTIELIVRTTEKEWNHYPSLESLVLVIRSQWCFNQSVFVARFLVGQSTQRITVLILQQFPHAMNACNSQLYNCQLLTVIHMHSLHVGTGWSIRTVIRYVNQTGSCTMQVNSSIKQIYCLRTVKEAYAWIISVSVLQYANT